MLDASDGHDVAVERVRSRIPSTLGVHLLDGEIGHRGQRVAVSVEVIVGDLLLHLRLIGDVDGRGRESEDGEPCSVQLVVLLLQLVAARVGDGQRARVGDGWQHVGAIREVIRTDSERDLVLARLRDHGAIHLHHYRAVNRIGDSGAGEDAARLVGLSVDQLGEQLSSVHLYLPQCQRLRERGQVALNSGHEALAIGIGIRGQPADALASPNGEPSAGDSPRDADLVLLVQVLSGHLLRQGSGGA